MSDKETVVKTSSSGIGLGSILGVVFIVLKLTGHIDWDWVWVLSPFWIPLAFSVLVIVVALLIAVLIAVVTRK